MMDCVKELKEIIKLYGDEIARTCAKIEVEQEKIDKLHLHNEKLNFLINRVSDMIEEIEFEHKKEAAGLAP